MKSTKQKIFPNRKRSSHFFFKQTSLKFSVSFAAFRSFLHLESLVLLPFRTARLVFSAKSVFRGQRKSFSNLTHTPRHTHTVSYTSWEKSIILPPEHKLPTVGSHHHRRQSSQTLPFSVIIRPAGLLFNSIQLPSSGSSSSSTTAFRIFFALVGPSLTAAAIVTLCSHALAHKHPPTRRSPFRI